MAMTPERLLYQRIRESLGKEWDVQRIESTTGNGIPDITASNPALGEFWIEAKAEHRPRLRPEQWAWLKRRAHMGGTCVIVAWDSEEKHFIVYPITDSAHWRSVGSYLVPFTEETCWEGKALHDILTNIRHHARTNRPS